MDESEGLRAVRAANAQEEEITLYVHDRSPKVVRALLENRNITEEHVLILANRKNLSPDMLETIFRDKRWSESYRIRLALARNPKTTMFTAVSIARFLRLFDLADLARNHLLPILYRRKLEAIVIEKIPTLPLGMKKSLAKVAAGEILLALIQDGYPEVVKQCLENPRMVEASLYRIISRKMTRPGTIRAISEHKLWTCRSHIKLALVRNEHAPLSRTVPFLSDLKTSDLGDLFRDSHVPPAMRPFIHRELIARGQDPEQLRTRPEDPIYEIADEELDTLDAGSSGYAPEENDSTEEQRKAEVGDENNTSGLQ